MNISDASHAAKLPPKTIRYYEDIGLVQPHRDANGYRVYTETDIHRLTFLARARGLGFSIDECRHLLTLYDDKHRASADVKALAEAHLAEIDAKLNDLRAMRDTLGELVAACAGDDRPDCPILKGLSDAG